MNGLPQRAPRLRLDSAVPAVLRFQDGQRTSGKLQVVSLTGGLLSLSNTLAQGSQVKLMFLTHTGSVLGGAEMLDPLSRDLQPFRFVSLGQADQRRLGATIRASLPKDGELQWIEKFRAASVQGDLDRRLQFKLAIAAFGLTALAMTSAAYLLHSYLLR
jgi:hypothetical protein